MDSNGYVWTIDMSSGEVAGWDGDHLRSVGMPDGYRNLDEVSGEELVPLLPVILKKMAQRDYHIAGT